MNNAIRLLMILFSQKVTVNPMIFNFIVTDIDGDNIVTDDFYDVVEDF